MMKQIKRPFAAKNEDGSVLIIALIFTAAMGLVVGGIAQLALVNLRNTVGTRDQRGVVYSADAAIKAAINMGPTDACRDDTDPLKPELPVVNGITDRSVECLDPDTGGSELPGGNQPKLAIITLPSPGEVGFSVDSGGKPYVKGGLYSKTNIAVAGSAALTVDGRPLTARTGCVVDSDAATLTVIPPEGENCDIGTASYPDGEDPLYAAAVNTPPEPASVPSCPAIGPVVMSPGTYTDAAALETLFRNTGPCADRVFHFPPNSDGSVGVYYFRFTNSGTRTWTLGNKDTRVVGGTLPTGQTLLTIGALPVTQPLCDAAAPGVQFIFGGDSRLSVTAGRADICAQHDETKQAQQIAVYGVPGTDLPGPPPDDASSDPGHFSNRLNALSANGDFATATVSNTAPKSKSITLTGLNPAGIPPGSTINSLKFEVTHRQTSTGNPTNFNSLNLLATLIGTGHGASFACTSGSGCLQKGPGNHTDLATVLTGAFPTVASLQNLSLVYTATKTGGNGSVYNADLDGVTLLINYSLPGALHRQSGCLLAAPYPSASGSCPLIQTSGAQTNLSIYGTVYAPLAAVDVQLTNSASQVFGRGIIVRAVKAKVTSSSDCGPPDCSPFMLPDPDDESGATSVVFQATVEGNRRLRALVEFSADSPPFVRSWSTMNEP